jgi:Rad3-related DNA helicase
MTYMFRCSRCRRLHTTDEYLESRFCRACGTFISTGAVFIPTKPQRHSHIEALGFFPYTPYPQQLDFMKDVTQTIRDHGILVAEACNGFGKTVCALASLLSLDRSIIYVTRTHEQVRQVLLEVEHINHTMNKTVSAVNLASRQHLCLNTTCQQLSAVDAVDSCRLLREEDLCPYRSEAPIPRGIAAVLSITRLRQIGEARRLCPYFLARAMAEHATVVVAPYQYVFNERIRSLMNLNLSRKVLVFDEAHNADHIGQDAMSDALSERSLTEAQRELKTLRLTAPFLTDLTAHLEQQTRDPPTLEWGTQFQDTLCQVTNTPSLLHLVSEYSEYIEAIRISKMARGSRPSCFLNGVLRFLEHVATQPRDGFVAIYRKSPRGINRIDYRCLDPSLAINPVVNEAQGTLVMSGTLSPMALFTELLGFQEAETQSYTAIANPANVRAYVDLSVTTRYSERGDAMTQRYGEQLLQVIPKIPHGVLVFFPQRRLLQNTITSWKRMSVIQTRQTHMTLGGKSVFVEGASAQANRQMVEAYKQAAMQERGAILCCVFRGRNAEGSNFPYDEARGVVLIGVPYADYSDPVVQAQINYSNRKQERLGERWYVMDAFRAANQALGRGIRHRDDSCTFILMDHRYGTYHALISSWATQSGVSPIDELVQ